MRRAGRTLIQTAREGEDTWFDLHLAASQCARVFVVADHGLESFHAITMDPAGTTLASVQSTSGFAVIGPDGAWCAAQSGEYRTRIVIDKGAGTLAAEAWTLPVR